MNDEREIYIHIPFCRKKCGYCDFYSGVASEEVRASYVETVCKEIEETPYADTKARVSSIFFGGGTPSLLTVSQISRILAALSRRFLVDASAEITMEMNPGTVTGESLRGYRALGINRASFGLQSAEDRLPR